MKAKVTKGFCIKMTPEDHRVLEKASEMSGRSMSQVVRELLRAYIEPSTRSGRLFPGPEKKDGPQLELSGAADDEED